MSRIIPALLLLAAFVLVAAVARAAQDDPRLDALFDKLKSGSDEEARATEREIWQIWVAHKNPEIARLMQHGMAALSEDDTQEALDTSARWCAPTRTSPRAGTSARPSNSSWAISKPASATSSARSRSSRAISARSPAWGRSISS